MLCIRGPDGRVFEDVVMTPTLAAAAGSFASPAASRGSSADAVKTGSLGSPLPGESGRMYAAGESMPRIAPTDAATPTTSRALSPSPAANAAPASSVPSLAVVDELTLSDDALGVDQAPAIPTLREMRIERIQAAIADGTYETEDKLSLALDRLLDEIG